MGQPPLRQNGRTHPVLVIADHGREKNFAGYRKICSLRDSPLRTILHRVGPGLGHWVDEVLLGAKCFQAGLRARDPAVFVTVASGHGIILAFLQYIFRPFRRPLLHGVFDVLLEEKRKGLRGWLESIKMFFLKESIDLCLIWGKADLRAYEAEYGFPAAKLRFCPHHVTLDDYEFTIENRGFIFSGGNGQRDYRTLIEAMEGVDARLFIATTLSGIREMAAGNPNIEVRGVSGTEFRNIMAGSRFVVLCGDPSYLRTMGHQTFLNAMWMGKPVIIADERSAEGYIVDGENGYVVPAREPRALRSRVVQLLEDDSLCQRIGESAMRYARQPMFTTLNCMQRVYNEVLRLAAERYQLPSEETQIKLY